LGQTFSACTGAPVSESASTRVGGLLALLKDSVIQIDDSRQPEAT
jgi:hypothetical protein